MYPGRQGLKKSQFLINVGKGQVGSVRPGATFMQTATSGFSKEVSVPQDGVSSKSLN